MAQRQLLISSQPAFSRNYVRTIMSPAHRPLKTEHYDITIAGRGIIGMAMACAIAMDKKLCDKKVLFLKSSPQKKIPKKAANDVYSNRVVSLNTESRKFFESLGIWNHIVKFRFKTVNKKQIWCANSNALVTLDDDIVYGVSYVVENDVIMWAMEKMLQDVNSNITTKYKTRIKHITFADSKPVKLLMDDSEIFTSEILIGADGSDSKTRTATDIPYLKWSCNQSGIVATVKLFEPTENQVIWQRFLPSGSIALLPLTGELSSLIWSTSVEETDRLLNLSEEAFVDAINDTFWAGYPNNELANYVSQEFNESLKAIIQSSSPIRQLPPSVLEVIRGSRSNIALGFGQAARYAESKVVLVGDAAHRLHPLAGQDVNQGLDDVQCLTNIISSGFGLQEKLSSEILLRKYESERRKQNFPMISVINRLQQLYDSSAPILLLRILGFQLAPYLEPFQVQQTSESPPVDGMKTKAQDNPKVWTRKDDSFYIRLLLPREAAVLILGSRSENILRIRTSYKNVIVKLTPHFNSVEYVLLVKGHFDIVKLLIAKILPYLANSQEIGKERIKDKMDFRMLVAHSEVEHLVGEGSKNIKAWSQKTGAQITMHHHFCPESSERVFQFYGGENHCIYVIHQCVEILRTSLINEKEREYNPFYYNQNYSLNYGGYRDSSCDGVIKAVTVNISKWRKC